MLIRKNVYQSGFFFFTSAIPDRALKLIQNIPDVFFVLFNSRMYSTGRFLSDDFARTPN